MSEPIKILLIGAKGRMGQAIIGCSESNNAVIYAACDIGEDPSAHIESCDAVIDFSFHETTLKIAELAVKFKKSLVIGTTGHSPKSRQAIVKAIGESIPVVWAGNYSIGVNTMNYLTKKAAQLLKEKFEAELLEMHHNKKKDAPSGTAERLLEILKSEYKITDSGIQHGREGQVGARKGKEIGVHALRGGDVVGEHTVYFCGEGERLELTHKATDRRIFAQGAILAAHWSINAKAGIHKMEDVLGISD